MQLYFGSSIKPYEFLINNDLQNSFEKKAQIVVFKAQIAKCKFNFEMYVSRTGTKYQ